MDNSKRHRSIELAKHLEICWGVTSSPRLINKHGLEKSTKVHERMLERLAQGKLTGVKNLSGYYVRSLESEPDPITKLENPASEPIGDEFIEKYLAKQRARGQKV